MGGQADVALALFRDKGWLASLIQRGDVISRGMRFTDMIQHIKKSLVFLTKHLTQQDGDIFNLLQGLRTKEIRCIVIGFQQGLILWCYHWRQLLQVANH